MSRVRYLAERDLKMDRRIAKKTGRDVQRVYHGPEGLRIYKARPTGDVVKKLGTYF